jgi:saccharopine dehydrogenase-like NADP-dependent oxidoreductase
MNRTVGYTASIVAQLIANGEIKRKGLLTPVRDIPYQRFLDEIKKRGIIIREKVDIEGRF